MTKRDLVTRISNDTGMIQQDVLLIVQRTLDILAESLSQGETVELRNFGVFEVKIRKARVGRNPNSPNSNVHIPPRAVVKFKAGKQLRSIVDKLTTREQKSLVRVASHPTESAGALQSAVDQSVLSH